MEKSLSEIARSADSDKSQSAGYIANYERHFGPVRHAVRSVLELGVLRGGSLLMWREYFAGARITGLDSAPCPFLVLPDRLQFYQGSQDDQKLLDHIAAECAPEGFDVVIDDASHHGTLARASFRSLFGKHLKRGGIYVIEDWGTGYWDGWPDGALYRPAEEHHSEQRPPENQPHVDRNFAAHNFGMVGFVKELVDEVGWADVTEPGKGNGSLPRRESLIAQMTIYFGQVFVVRA